MSTLALPEPPKPKQGDATLDHESKDGFDPDSFRMTVGEHLEELRSRIILALVGFTVAIVACLAFSERVMVFFCALLTRQLVRHDITPQMFYTNLTDPFMTYLKISMISAAASPGRG